MRISVDQDDPGYSPELAWKPVIIRLDGVAQPRCITADTERGFVTVVEADADGNLVLDENGHDVRLVTRFGVVTVEIEPVDGGAI